MLTPPLNFVTMGKALRTPSFFLCKVGLLMKAQAHRIWGKLKWNNACNHQGHAVNAWYVIIVALLLAILVNQISLKMNLKDSQILSIFLYFSKKGEKWP